MKITKSKQWYWKAYLITSALAWGFCIIPTLIAGILNLPLIAVKNAEATLTGSFTVVLICCIYPLYKGIVRLFKSPSAPVIMWLLFGITYLLYNISKETLGAMVTIFLIASIGNTIGAILFMLAKGFKAKGTICGTVELAQQLNK